MALGIFGKKSTNRDEASRKPLVKEMMMMQGLKDELPNTQFRRAVSDDPFAERKNSPIGIDPHALARAAAARIDAIEREMSLDLRGKAGGAKLAAHPAADDMMRRSGMQFNRVAPPPGVVVAPEPERKLSKADFQVDNPTRLLENPITTMVLGNTSLQELVEVKEAQTAPAVERAAIMYANGQTREAAQVLLEEMSKPGALGISEFNAYRMLFDLLRYLGAQNLFDKFALDFTQRFDKTPPSWELAEAPKPLILSETPSVDAGERLDANVVPALEQLKVLSMRSKTMRLDLSNVNHIDLVGVELLMRVLKAFENTEFNLQLYGLSNLLIVLDKTMSGTEQPVQMYWLFKLQIIRITGKTRLFEDAAIDFAGAFGLSPPSWQDSADNIKDAEQMLDAPTTIMQVERDDHLFLSGEVLGDGQELIDLIAVAFNTGQSTILCDCYGLNRIEFVGAGRLLTALTAWTAEGKTVQFLNLNHPVASLFVSLGIHHLAVVERRKDN